MARLLHRAIERHLRTWARQHGVRDGRGEGIAALQRFGGSLNLNVHVHALVLDGVFARAAGRHVRFHPTPAPSAMDMADILATLVPAVQRLLGRHGLLDEDVADPFAASLVGWHHPSPVSKGSVFVSEGGQFLLSLDNKDETSGLASPRGPLRGSISPLPLLLAAPVAMHERLNQQTHDNSPESEISSLRHRFPSIRRLRAA